MHARILQLFAQTGNVHRQRVFIHKAVRFPQSRHEVAPGNDLPTVLQQKLQYAQFIPGEGNILSVQVKHAAFRVEHSAGAGQKMRRCAEVVGAAQDSLRPNNRLSDMQAIMEQTQAFENRVLERLNAGKTVRSFLITAVELLTEAVNLLVLQVFRKDDYAVKYAVEPLLDGDGPLGDLSVRLKLIYGLGVINRQEYEDAELLMALREELNHDGNEYAFTDDEILGPFGELHCVAALPPPPQFEPADSSLYAMQIQRYQQAVRSTMVLSLTELISKISLKKAFQK